MTWQPIVRLDLLEEGAMRQFPRTGGDLLLCRTSGEVFALGNDCPHAGGPLAMGNFSPPLLACPWHAWEFDCRTGQCTHAAAARLATYPVEIRNGHVWADLPDPTTGEAA